MVFKLLAVGSRFPQKGNQTEEQRDEFMNAKKNRHE